jgi:hypothetical protein
MSSKKEEKKIEPISEENNAVDPFSQMFQFYDNFQKSWAGVVSETVSSKGFAESMGQQLESSLDTMTLFRRQFGDMMEQYLQQMSLPTRNEIISLGKRLAQLEMSLDDVDAKLDQVLDILKKKIEEN